MEKSDFQGGGVVFVGRFTGLQDFATFPGIVGPGAGDWILT